ncbi:MAG: phosphate starvation-inducible protein PhoH [Lentisphaerae bacterium RIFOXYB12_FULL_65_16]|nr:MAG: phosphate starvation-inducible protein PhoH [Lentisphaerae bacterium RIFOXYA12_64_32]OGV91612.1 MAG: phosphate starvation-inducible protein PhoH [Lentisphaerae bacterium RIFOXYB12_FULL_65_16]
MASRKKLFVLDTNVILHDSSCIRRFEEHDIVVPITVLEELDQFKKGNGTLNYHAREFLRELDHLSGDRLFDGGVPIGEGLGRVIVRFEQRFDTDLAAHFSRKEPDHLILNTAYQCAKENPGRKVVVVSKDVNLRMKAKSIGLFAEDYTNDHVRDLDTLEESYRVYRDMPDDVLLRLYEEPCELDIPECLIGEGLGPNEYLILQNHARSALAATDPKALRIRRVIKQAAYGITPRNAEQTFALDALTNPQIQLVTITGKAGTGKTLLALAAALETRKLFRQIFLARPVVPLSNRDMGYLPGDVNSKLDPYMQPLYDNLAVIKDQFPESSGKHVKIDELLTENKLTIAPLAYIRGRSLVRIFFIVDEAQNLTPHEVKTIITRAGEGTKLVFTGDIFQIDHPYLDKYSNGLSYLVQNMRGQPLHAHINLVRGERSELADLASRLL